MRGDLPLASEGLSIDKLKDTFFLWVLSHIVASN